MYTAICIAGKCTFNDTFGPRKSFNFTLKVKAAVLQDLKLIRRRDYRDTPI